MSLDSSVWAEARPRFEEHTVERPATYLHNGCAPQKGRKKWQSSVVLLVVVVVVVFFFFFYSLLRDRFYTRILSSFRERSSMLANHSSLVLYELFPYSFSNQCIIQIKSNSILLLDKIKFISYKPIKNKCFLINLIMDPLFNALEEEKRDRKNRKFFLSRSVKGFNQRSKISYPIYPTSTYQSDARGIAF